MVPQVWMSFLISYECVSLHDLISRLSILPQGHTMVMLICNVCFHCTGSNSAAESFRAHIPGVEDFPRIKANNYFLFENFNFPHFEVLGEIFNETQRSQTFMFPIYVDDVPEGVEELNLTLSLLMDDQLPLQPGSVIITPAVATVRIRDSSSKFVEQFIMH